ncbi:hypothetical protein GDO78_009293 [Eleutherodactylus coqui]|uniref:Uncharacterized protein n=1 Tax=Eleutherodactylus coqui TaxID=57060 RepID=A0A8J6K8Q8_ELECQ|nr:hypothetical protein GDO78_009293 [Eleutherodactylus coqui]
MQKRKITPSRCWTNRYRNANVTFSVNFFLLLIFLDPKSTGSLIQGSRGIIMPLLLSLVSQRTDPKKESVPPITLLSISSILHINECKKCSYPQLTIEPLYSNKMSSLQHFVAQGLQRGAVMFSPPWTSSAGGQHSAEHLRFTPMTV